VQANYYKCVTSCFLTAIVVGTVSIVAVVVGGVVIGIIIKVSCASTAVVTPAV
jgi:hypothetical protein